MSSSPANSFLSGDSYADRGGDADCDDDVDAVDADTFEILNGKLPAIQSDGILYDLDLELMPLVEDLAPSTIRLEVDDSETTPLLVINQFLFGNPSAPISSANQDSCTDDTGHTALRDSIWSPFCSKCDWDIAHWAKRHNLTSLAITEFLTISGVQNHLLIHCFPTNVWWKVVPSLGLSFSTVKELNDMIDRLPGHPTFVCQDITVGDELLKFYYRDILASIRTLYGNPSFQHDLVFAPEQHFTNNERTCHVYNEMYTGDWWWSVQVRKRVLSIFGT